MGLPSSQRSLWNKICTRALFSLEKASHDMTEIQEINNSGDLEICRPGFERDLMLALEISGIVLSVPEHPYEKVCEGCTYLLVAKTGRAGPLQGQQQPGEGERLDQSRAGNMMMMMSPLHEDAPGLLSCSPACVLHRFASFGAANRWLQRRAWAGRDRQERRQRGCVSRGKGSHVSDELRERLGNEHQHTDQREETGM
ncbi:hypothetical protein Q9966_001288 [Columba livia]|nr:hypothetical protein Q9966_001288 [Columba livia]